MAHGEKVLSLPSFVQGEGRASLRCILQAEGFNALELRCGLFGSDLELLDANECPEKLGCSRSAVVWAKGQVPGNLELELQLHELPPLLEHLVLATVGRTGSQGGSLYLSISAGRFHHQYKRTQFPERGQSTLVQGSMLAVLSKMPKGWLLQEVVPNIGLTCEQQQDATVRELYWPEVGVAIERTVTSEAGPSKTWLEVFRAYPEGTCASDDETETASHGSPLGSRPELVTSVSPQSSEPEKLEKASLGSGLRESWKAKQREHSGYSHHALPHAPSSLRDRWGQDSSASFDLDFGPPRATPADLELHRHRQKNQDHQDHQVAELCQEAGQLSVNLKLSEDRLRTALRGELTQLQEEKRMFWETERLKENQVLKLRSELDHSMSELAQQNATLRAQREELEQIAQAKATEMSKQERHKGELVALRQELHRMNQQLADEKGAWQQEKQSLQINLNEVMFKAEADKERLQQQIHAHRAEISCCRLEAQEAVEAKQAIARTLANVPTGPTEEASLEVEQMRSELAKIQADFAEELGSARARLAVAERRNKELLESLQGTLQAPPAARFQRPASLPAPPAALPNSEMERRHDSAESRGHVQPQGRRPESDVWKVWAQKNLAEEVPWDFNVPFAHSTGTAEPRTLWDGSKAQSGASDASTMRHLGRLPSAPSAAPSNDSVGDRLRRAAARRRAQGKATRALDEEYARFVKESSRGRPGPQISSRDLMEVRQGIQRSMESLGPVEPFILSDLGSA
ncbi:unnamed protein product [Durusdinium trenchii]|uniref:Uncharacterized protein n=2 Tax=Durusdinium trenchii TaxID=1381693 RepID=A0ABP0PPG6_9DINO